MKRFLLALAGLLPAALHIYAQPVAQYATDEHDFGMLTWHVPGLTTFYVTNVGNSDLYINNVRTDCGCTAVTWTHDPIRPGETGSVSATYDSELLGHFHKSIAVYTNASDEPAYLGLKGQVVIRKKEYSGEFPYQIDDIYLNTNELEFDDVYRGDTPQEEIIILNTSKEPYSPELMHLPKYLTAEADPKVLRPGRVGRIRVTLDSEHLHNMGLTQTQVYLSRFPGDRVNKDNEITVSATLLPEFDLTPEEMDRIPVAVIDSTNINLGSLGGKKRVRGQLTLSNDGKSPLVIRTLQVYNPGIGVKLGKRRIAPGESTKLKITVSADSQHFRGRRRVLLITNDPNHPKIAIDVTVDK